MRTVAAERLSLITSSPAIAFLYRICIWPDSTGIFFLRERNTSIKDLFYIQRTQAFVGVRGSKKPQTTHFLLLEIVWWDHGSNWVRSSQAWSWG